MLGLTLPTWGGATVDGRPYRELKDPVAVVGAVLEGPQFHPGRTGRNHLRVLARAAGLPVQPGGRGAAAGGARRGAAGGG